MRMSPDTKRRRSANAIALRIASPIVAMAIGLPAAAVAQQATFANNVLSVPAVRVGNLDYPNVTLGTVPHPSALAFRLTGAGQPSPSVGATNVFDGSTLRLPSVQVGGTVYRDVDLTLSDPATYEFVLSGFTPPMAPATELFNDVRIGDPYWPDGATPTGGQGQTVAGIPCGNIARGYHVHAHLTIMLNGRALAIPGRIGILPETPTRPTCYYALHIHDNSGKVHMETATPTTFTLGQLFQIWGQPLSPTNVAGITGLPVVVYITDNGVTKRYSSGDPAAIELLSKRLITIQIGSPATAIPNYTWEGP